MIRLHWKTVLSLCIFTVMLLNSSFMFRVEAQDISGDDLFKFVWDDTLGTPPIFGGYYIVSERVFDLDIYAVSLPTVDNYRASDHSAVVEGVEQAVKIRPGTGDVKELTIPLWFDLFMKLNVSVSCHLVDDWNVYKALVELGNNTIIVNTHDEYLPVPEGYTKEEWADKIADFMLNRWGTWVHAGGYPFYRVWHQNGTKEEWGENGFKKLMSYIGKENITCYPPPNWNPEDPATFSMWAEQGMGVNWYVFGNSILDFAEANLGFPINYEDFEMQYINGIYSYGQYKPGAVIRYSQNESAFNFGIYIHMSPWQFYDINGIKLPSELPIGFISTAVAVYAEFSYASCKLYGRAGDSASEVIQTAEKEGRTVRLAEAKSLFQNALDAFASGNYKLSTAYANQAKLTAEKATTPNTLSQIIAIIGITTTSIGVGVYYKIKRKQKKQCS